MTKTIIRIDLDAIDARLKTGQLWTTGWGDWESPDGKTCLHGAIRYCQPIPGDAQLIQQVGARFGFGAGDNDTAADWQTVKALVQPDITDEMLAETFGPQWEHLVALVRRAAVMTGDEAKALRAARDAAWDDAARYAARDAARGAAWYAAAWYAAREAAWYAPGGVARGVARGVAGDAAWALSIRDLIGQHGFTQAHYDALSGPWRKTIGPIHPDDAPMS